MRSLFELYVTVLGAITLIEHDTLHKFRTACKGLKAYTATADCVATVTSGDVLLMLHLTFEVKIDSLKGKKIGMCFSSSRCGSCQKFTPAMVEVYNELASKGDLEVVFLTADEDDESFNKYFSKMSWLAIPFFDSKAREQLDELFIVRGIPHLILGESGDLLTEDGVDI